LPHPAPSPSTPAPDFFPPALEGYFTDLQNWSASDAESAQLLASLNLQDTELVALSEFHGSHGRETALICFDAAATWDIPGTAEIVAIHVQRELADRVFTLRSTQLPTVPLAHQWLAGRGVPSSSLRSFPGMERSADQMSQWSEERIRTSGERFKVVDHYTYSDNVVWVIFEDLDPGGLDPFLVQLETPDPDLDYRVREGRHATFQDAWTWCVNRDGPPTPTSELIPRSHAAIRISTFMRQANLARTKTPPATPSTGASPSTARADRPRHDR